MGCSCTKLHLFRNMHYSPLISTPLSDFTAFWVAGSIYNNTNPLCDKLDLKLMDCLEAYGLKKGSEKCAEIYYDVTECKRGTFQKLRSIAIHKERMRQYRAGKLAKPFEEYPPLDSFMYM